MPSGKMIDTLSIFVFEIPNIFKAFGVYRE
jgi:hypothetical protein